MCVDCVESRDKILEGMSDETYENSNFGYFGVWHLVSPAKLTDFIEGREIFKKGGGNAAKRTRRKRKQWPSV